MDSTGAQRSSFVWDAIRYHPFIVAIAAVVGLGLGLAAIALLPSQQSAIATILLRPLDGNPYSTTSDQDSLVALETEAQLVRSDEVTQLVIDALDLDDSVPTLRQAVRTSVPPNTQVLDIEYTDPAGGSSETVAQAYADEYLEYRLAKGVAYRDSEVGELDEQIDAAEQQLETLTDAPASTVGPSVVSAAAQQVLDLRGERQALAGSELDPGEVIVPARDQQEGVGLLRLLVPLAGLLFGALLGVVLAAVRERSVGVIRNLDDLGDYEAPTICVVPKAPRGTTGMTDDQKLAIRGLATTVGAAGGERGSMALAPVPPVAGVGELADITAQSLAMRGGTAVVVDASKLGDEGSSLAEDVERGVRGLLATARTGDEGVAAEASRLGLSPGSDVRRWEGNDPEAPRVVLLALPSTESGTARTLLSAVESVAFVVELGRTRRSSFEDALRAATYSAVHVVGIVAVHQDLTPAPRAGTAGSASSEEPTNIGENLDADAAK